MEHLARSRSMMVPQRAAVMIVLISLGAGVVADGHISRLSGPRAPVFSSPVREPKILSQNKNENLSEYLRTSATGLRQSLSDYLWSSVTDLLQEARNTTFLAGVRTGDMNPNFYGEYIMQDAAWCREVAKLWRQLANNGSVAGAVTTYANNSYSGYQTCSTYLFAAWHIKDDGEDNHGVHLQAVPANYVNTIRNAMLEYPPDMLIATFACVKLWSNVTADLWSYLTSTETNCSNPYRIWVEENKGNSSATRQAATIDEWDQLGWYNWNSALTLFRQAMKGEITMFNLKAIELVRSSPLLKHMD